MKAAAIASLVAPYVTVFYEETIDGVIVQYETIGNITGVSDTTVSMAAFDAAYNDDIEIPLAWITAVAHQVQCQCPECMHRQFLAQTAKQG